VLKNLLIIKLIFLLTIFFSSDSAFSIHPVEIKLDSYDTIVEHNKFFQVSLAPFLGTNWKQSSYTTNSLSMNILGGYAKGLQGFEIGGLVNLLKDNMKGCQIAGFMNYSNRVNGIQAAGMINIAKSNVNHAQISLVANYAKMVEGVQLGGVANFSKDTVTGGQIAGLINYGKTGGKYQLSCGINIAKENFDGVQLSVCNYSKKVNGYQVGIINFTNTIESGFQLGILSFASKGIHRFEISYNEIFMINARYLTGVERFYNIINLGYNFYDYIASGYGIGTQFNLTENLHIHLEIVSDLIWNKNDSYQYAGTMNKLSSTLDVKAGKHYSLFIGPSFTVSEVTPNIGSYIYLTSNKKTNLWIGGVLGASFTL
jgi:hypothetical protein